MYNNWFASVAICIAFNSGCGDDVRSADGMTAGSQNPGITEQAPGSNSQVTSGAMPANVAAPTAAPGRPGGSPSDTSMQSMGATSGAAGGVAAPTMTPAGMAPGGTMGGAGTNASGGTAGAAGMGQDSGAGSSAMTVASDNCDRACLLGYMDRYVDALLASDHTQLPLSSNVRYTENGAEGMLGATVWQSASNLLEDTRLDFADPEEGQVGSQFVFSDGAGSVIYQVRLKVEKAQITEIESMAVRQDDIAFFSVEGMKTQPVFKETPSQPMSREELRAITELYLDYLDGKKTGAELPFAEDCARYENGVNTAPGKGSFEAQAWGFETTHRILVIDEEAGITWGMFPFSQDDESLVVGEAFKILDGEIKMIQAVMRIQPTHVWD